MECDRRERLVLKDFRAAPRPELMREPTLNGLGARSCRCLTGAVGQAAGGLVDCCRAGLANCQIETQGQDTVEAYLSSLTPYEVRSTALTGWAELGQHGSMTAQQSKHPTPFTSQSPVFPVFVFWQPIRLSRGVVGLSCCSGCLLVGGAPLLGGWALGC